VDLTIECDVPYADEIIDAYEEVCESQFTWMGIFAPPICQVTSFMRFNGVAGYAVLLFDVAASFGFLKWLMLYVKRLRAALIRGGLIGELFGGGGANLPGVR
jgi:hypothetical protein